MSKRSVLVSAFLTLGWTAGHTQNCESFYPLMKGVVMEMTEYDGAHKMAGTTTSTVLDVTKDAAGIAATVQNEYVDAKGKDRHKITYTIKCDGKSIYIDMQSMMQNMDRSNGKDEMEMKADGAFIEVPMNPRVGEQLKDGVMTLHMSSHGKEMGKMTMTVRRKIESKESITVPAGTFECFRISSEMINEMDMMGMKRPMGKTISTNWFSPGTGPVKSETYNDGKLIRMSELTRITK